MNVLFSHVALRERKLLDVLDLAVRLLAAHARVYAVLSAAVLAPAYLASLALARAVGDGWAWGFALALSLVVQAPFTTLASRLVFETTPAVRDVVTSALRALPAVASVRLVQAVLVVSAGLFFLLPAVWLAAISLFVLEVTALERASLGAALTRSQRIVATGSGDALMLSLLLPLLHLAAVALGDAAGRAVLLELLEVRPPGSLWETGGGALALAGFWAFVPYVATARFLVYLNFRTRSEGWDVQTRFAALAARARAEGEALS